MADVTDTTYTVADDAIPAFGTQWLIGDDASPETFQAVKGVVAFTPGASTRSTIDVTHLRSPENHEEVIAGLRRSEPFSGTLIWLPDDESQSYAGGGSGSFTGGGLAKIAETGEIRTHKLKFASPVSPDKEMTFRGFVLEFTPATNIEIDGKLGATIQIKPSGSYLSTLPA